MIEPPYNLELATIFVPGSINGNSANICAACPDAAQQAPNPSSKAAIFCSKADIVGLDSRP